MILKCQIHFKNKKLIRKHVFCLPFFIIIFSDIFIFHYNSLIMFKTPIFDFLIFFNKYESIFIKNTYHQLFFEVHDYIISTDRVRFFFRQKSNSAAKVNNNFYIYLFAKHHCYQNLIFCKKINRKYIIFILMAVASC